MYYNMVHYVAIYGVYMDVMFHVDIEIALCT
jgi:hypothetical protein